MIHFMCDIRRQQTVLAHGSSARVDLPERCTQGVHRTANRTRQIARSLYFALCFGLLMLALPKLVWSQSKSSINGTVVDATGAAVAGADLALADKGTGQERHATSSVEGYYNFPELQPSTYSLKVTAP